MTVNPTLPLPAKAVASEPSWSVLALAAVAQFMVILDVTVVNVALPSIGSDLGFSASGLSWVITAYVLFTGGLMLLGGRLTDLGDRRALFLSGLGLFTAASLASGLAWAPGALVAARAAQGVGAALLLPSALSIVTTTYSGHRRAVALGVWGALGSAGAAAGVLFGGVIVTALDWRWVFFVNVPVGLAVAALTPRLIASAGSHGLRAGRLDLPGAGALLGSLVVSLLAVTGAAEHGWGSARTLALGAAGAALLAVFAAVERRSSRPLVPPSTWRIRSLVSSGSVMLVATGTLVGAFFLSTLQLQQALGASALGTGLAFLPLTLLILAGAHMASNLLPRAGARTIASVGMTLAAAGALLLSGTPDRVVDLLPGFLVLGLGIGMAFVSVSVAAMADVDHHEAGLASGLMTTAHELGAAIGVAVVGALAVSAGHAEAFVAVAGIAAAAALLAVLAVPAVRPEPGGHAGLH